ncbi:MAG: hypothetical protein Q8R70_10585, partial [Methanoregula sp.]|nr:hypothetical protein [Methanoregula sp.]
LAHITGNKPLQRDCGGGFFLMCRFNKMLQESRPGLKQTVANPGKAWNMRSNKPYMDSFSSKPVPEKPLKLPVSSSVENTPESRPDFKTTGGNALSQWLPGAI